MTERRGVLICGETAGGVISQVTTDLIGPGRKLSAILEGQLSCVFIGQNTQAAAHTAIAFGVDKVYVSEALSYSETHPERIAALLAQICGQLEPFLILFSRTDTGRDIAPRLGARLDASVCLDCSAIEIDADTGSLHLTKPVYGGNAVAVWTSKDHRPQIVSLRPGSAAPVNSVHGGKGEIIRVEEETDDSLLKGRLVETIRDEIKGVKLEDANVIVAGGGGIGGSEGFRLIEELARILHGAVGVSRVPCDEGWMPKNVEIGQTGHYVSPELYIAVGISGAPQHLAGCTDAKCIVAINKDPEAHIFKDADFGIVGDYREALPAFIAKLKSLLGN